MRKENIRPPQPCRSKRPGSTEKRRAISNNVPSCFLNIKLHERAVSSSNRVCIYAWRNGKPENLFVEEALLCEGRLLLRDFTVKSKSMNDK